MLSFNVTWVHVLYDSLFGTSPYSSHLLSQSYVAPKNKVYYYATSITLNFFVRLSLDQCNITGSIQQEIDWKLESLPAHLT